MTSAVQRIIELIDGLPAQDLEALEQALASRSEAAWLSEVESARQHAASRGVDQQAIDDAVDRHRYCE